MKKIAIWNNYTAFANNRAFDPTAYGIGEDIGYPIILLKLELEKLGYTVETLDMDKHENYEKIIFLDVPDPKKCCCKLSEIPIVKKYLVLTECQMIYKPNARKDLISEYHKVFAYNDDLVKNSGYVKLCIPNKLKTPLFIPFENKKFCTLIAGNKACKDRGELYSERLRSIDYFETNHPEYFEFYGFGWNEHRFYGNRIVRQLNRIPFLNKLLAKKHLCYKGSISKKLSVLSNYKFAICYENSCDIPGYITEKIWDCFFAGVVPVYLGAPNVNDYIPDNCFIDKRKFNSYEELFTYLNSISSQEYTIFVNNIKNFLLSEKAYIFSAECYAASIIKELSAD